MVLPNAWINSIQFEFLPPQLHQHLHLHSTCHLNNKTYPITPGTNTYTCVTCTRYRIQATSTNKWLHHFAHANLYTTTFLVHPPLTTSIWYWITINTSTTRAFSALTLLVWQQEGHPDVKNSPNRGLRSSPDLDPDLGWPWKSYRRECLIDL